MSEKLKLLLYVLLLSSFSLPSRAFTSLAHSCPDEFVATALHFSTSQTPLMPTKKITVLFEVNQTLKGGLTGKIDISFIPLKHSKIMIGKQYRVSMENGFLCALDVL